MNNNFLIIKKQISNDSLIIIKEPIKNLNYGGCGYFALKLYQKLNKGEYKIISINNLNHVCLLNKRTGVYIDSNGYHNLFWMQLSYGFPTFKVQELTEASLNKMVQNPKFWNTWFNRADTVIVNKVLNNF